MHDPFLGRNCQFSKQVAEASKRQLIQAKSFPSLRKNHRMTFYYNAQNDCVKQPSSAVEIMKLNALI